MNGVDVLRDKYGNRLGEIQIDGSKQVLVDRYFVRLGSYDAHDNLLPTSPETLLAEETLVSLLRQELASSRCWQNLRRVDRSRESGDDPGHLHQREANSCWMVGAATTIAVRSSDITNVTGPMRKNINRHRQAVGCRRHCWRPLPAEQHRERRGRWKDLSRGRAEVRNGRCGRKPFDSRARRSKDRCWPTTVIGLQTGTVDPSRTFSSTLPDGSPRSEATIARSGSGPRRLSHETAGRYAPHVWSSAVASFRSGVSKPSVNQP